MNNIKAVIFDMDGVLLDTEGMSDKAFIQAAKEINLLNIENFLDKCRGSNYQDTINLLQNEYRTIPNFNAKKFLERTNELFYELEYKQGIPLMKGAKNILEYLKNKNYKIALASSTKSQAVKRQLKNAGLIDYFETLTTGDCVEHSKPNPEIYLKACKSIELSPEECVAIEDSLNGVKSACSAKLKCIMVPDMVAPTEEIKSIVWKICSSLEEVKKVL